jgi:hypothetical protein
MVERKPKVALAADWIIEKRISTQRPLPEGDGPNRSRKREVNETPELKN